MSEVKKSFGKTQKKEYADCVEKKEKYMTEKWSAKKRENTSSRSDMS